MFMNSSETLTERFAVVALSTSVLRSMNSPMSGWSHAMETISAERRPFIPIRPVVVVNSSMKETAPEEVFAGLFTLAPAGARFDMSIPTPPPALYVRAVFFATS